MPESTQLKRCGFKPEFDPESADDIIRLEQLIGVSLPTDYRDFLIKTGGGYLNALAQCTLATPFGMHNLTVLHSADDVIGFLDSAITPRNMICIGCGNFGVTTCLSVAGLDHGQVFSLDVEMRFYWDDEVLSRFPHLDPKIREFFRKRDADELPPRPWGYDHCYHVADSFAEFLEKIHPSG